MLILLSPAKTLDYVTPAHIDIITQPCMLDQSQVLVDILQKMTQAELAKLMKLSNKLAALNTARYGAWQRPFDTNNAKQAVLAFKGDVYAGLQADSLQKTDLQWAQEHLRILSGLYGLLRPLDLMQAYRLEMGSKLRNAAGNDLYAFWGKQITDKINTALACQDSLILINLASNEYFKAVQPKRVQGDIITPIFKDQKHGKYKTVSFFAKKARGMMTRWIIKQRLYLAHELKRFSVAGYYYSPEQSTATDWVFLRDTTEG